MNRPRHARVDVDDCADPRLRARVARIFARYLTTLEADRAVLLARYSYRALAHKVVGVGSVGTRAMVMLLESGDGDPLLLQVKQAGTSVLEDVLPPATTPPPASGW